MKTTLSKDIDAYIAGFPKETQTVLKQMRRTIRRIVPDAEETISYGIPTFKQKGSYLVYFAGYKNHVSLYPAPRRSEAFKTELALYRGGKGTVQFPLDKPLPLPLITKIVKYLVQENNARSKPQTKKK